jgi:transposase
MPKPYGPEFRRDVIEALQSGLTLDEAAAHFSLGRATVNRWSSRFNKTGRAEAKPTGGPRNIKLDQSDLEVLLELVKAQPDATLEELVKLLEGKTGKRVGRSTVGRGLKKLNVTRKKKSLVASERDAPRVQDLRAKFTAWQGSLEPHRLVFVDEAGSHIAMTRTHGRSLRGEPVVARVPRNRGAVLTMIGALTVCGLTTMMTIEGGTDAAVFLAFVTEVLGPRLTPGDMVILDNAGAHKDARIKDAVEARGAKLVFLPPYSPDLNPIEECWSKVKSLLRSAAARTKDELNQALSTILDLVTPSDACGWIGHAGYRVEP